MGDSSTGHMNSIQQSVVKAALQEAFTNGQEFEDVDQIETFFRENKVLADFENNSRDIFNIYLKLRAGNVRQPLTPADSHLPLSPKNDYDRQPCPVLAAEVSDPCDGHIRVVALYHKLISDCKDPFVISFYVPRRDCFTGASARRCRGKECFISRTTVELQSVEVTKRRVLLKWHRTNKSDPFSQTWFRVAEPEVVENCDVAIGEECSTQDHELAEADGDNDDAVTDELMTLSSAELSKSLPNLEKMHRMLNERIAVSE
jgi:hypothetical protein